MKRGLLIVLILAGVVLLGVLWSIEKGGKEELPARVLNNHEVQMYDFYFEPETLTIAAGETVTWVNRGRGVHAVLTLRGTRILDSDNLKAGESWNFTFSEPGEYDYVSPIYPGMLGTVIVE